MPRQRSPGSGHFLRRCARAASVKPETALWLSAPESPPGRTRAETVSSGSPQSCCFRATLPRVPVGPGMARESRHMPSQAVSGP